VDRQQSTCTVIPGPRNGNDELKHSFLARPGRSDFIRSKHRRPTKILLFLLAALTIHRGMAKSIIRFCLDRIAGFDGAACAAKKR
jgi:hypothetical protein